MMKFVPYFLEALCLIGLSIYAGRLSGGFAVAIIVAVGLGYKGVREWHEKQTKSLVVKEIEARLERLEKEVAILPDMQSLLTDTAKIVTLMKQHQESRRQFI